jgi:putative nucleotidyltransferase with HDIG domain
MGGPAVTRTVLFVHDDPSAQRALEQALGPSSHGWQIDAARTAADALDRLTGGSYDVVVADGSPRGIGGRAFFVEVAARQPKAIRLALVGSGGRGMLVQAEGSAHQHFARPVDLQAAFERLERTLALGELMAGENLAAVIARMRAVPSLPTVYLAIMAELRQDDPSGSRVGELVAKDAGMSAKLLQLVNSPFFGLRMPVSDPSHAVQLLGLETVRALVLSMHIFEQFDERSVVRFRLNRVWRHSLSTAHCARLVARLHDGRPDTAGQATTAALLHDIGKLVLASALPDEYAAALDVAAGRGASASDAEREITGATHAEVGAYLLGLWGLPEEIVEAVAWHHRPSGSPSSHFCPNGVIHVADAIEHDVHPSDLSGAPPSIDAAYMERFKASWQYTAWKAAYSDAGGEGQGRGLAARL